MPYILLLIGLIFAVFGFYRFFLKAEPHQIKSMFLAIAAIGVGTASLYLAMTGRLPAALAILAALWPLGVSWLRSHKLHTEPALPTDRKEAYDILGLEDGASEEDIREAYLRLMKKVHPDQKGSDWLARKINAAKDLLLNK